MTVLRLEVILPPIVKDAPKASHHAPHKTDVAMISRRTGDSRQTITNQRDDLNIPI